MSNHYFQFKEFKVEQDKCAMKVCTDSCIFGAWITINNSVKNILDIGTGTGLLSLMLAQKHNAKIDSIEIDENAFLQAKINFENSTWKHKLNAILGNVTTFNFDMQYDFIVCNPPFYQNEMASINTEEKIAKHSLHLSLSSLILSIKKLLKTNGKSAILLPYYRKNEFELLAEQHQFFLEKTIIIKQTNTHDYFRYAAIFSKQKNEKIIEETLAIKTNNEYTAEAISLLKPYYLYL